MSTHSPSPNSKIEIKRDERIVFLGDSLTQAGVGKNGYVTLVSQSIDNTLPDNQIEIIGAGINGNKVSDCLQRLDRDVLNKKPSLVIIVIGINDVWHWTHPAVVAQGGKGSTAEEFESELQSLVSQIQNSGARVALCTPPVIGEKFDGSNPQDKMLEEFSAISRSIAVASKSHLIDLRKGFINHLKEINPHNLDQGILTTDTVHLTRLGNQVLANLIFNELLPSG